MRREHGNAYPFRRWLAVAALAGLSLSVHAERVSRSAFDAFMDLSTGATKHTVGMSRNGVPLATAGVPGATQVGNMNFSHAPGGWPVAGANVDVPSPITGKPLAATAKQGFTKASQAAALGRFAMKVATPLAVGVAIFDLVRELGNEGDWELESSSDGTDNKIWKVTSGTQCLSGCLEFKKSAEYSDGTWTTSLSEACSTYNMLSGYSVSFESVNGPSTCLMRWSYNNSTYTQTVGSRSIPPYDTRQRSQVTEAALVAALAAESGWPTDSSIDRALADAMKSSLVELQNSLDTEYAAQLASEYGRVSGNPVTSTLSDGTTKTETQTCEWVQGIPPGPLEWNCWTNTTTVTPQKTTTETVVKSNPDGTTSTETITKTTPSTTLTGTTTASASELNEKLCSDGSRRVMCSDLDTPVEEVPKSSVSVTYAPDDLGFGSGACPAPYGWSDSLGSHSVSLAPLCDKLSSIVRPLVIAFSLLMAVFIILPRES